MRCSFQKENKVLIKIFGIIIRVLNLYLVNALKWFTFKERQKGLSNIYPVRRSKLLPLARQPDTVTNWLTRRLNDLMGYVL